LPDNKLCYIKIKTEHMQANVSAVTGTVYCTFS